MTAAAAWRGAFIERLRATGNVSLAAAGAEVSRQQACAVSLRSERREGRRLIHSA